MPKNSKLRSSLEDASGLKIGTVLILLAGRFRGKRVVLVARDPKGALIVSGPYKLNGVPLRRVDPAYVIATSTKIDLGKIDTSSVGANFFARAKTDRKKGEAAFFNKDGAKAELPAEKKAAQQKVDDQILKAVSKNADMAKYLAATFTLRDHDTPHTMKF